jgi:hypothetical protein
MPSCSIELAYNGHSFFIDVAEGNMVDLNKLHEISGAPKGKEPKEWSKLPGTKNLIKSINGGKSPILKTKRGVGGGTWAHWQLALSYAQYLSPELHLAVNQVFKERLEETLNPELGIERSRERARRTWKAQGKDETWISTREQGIDSRKGVFGKDKSEIEADLRAKNPNLPKQVNIRDHAKRSSLMAIGLAEALASEEIEEFDIRGVRDCAQVSFDKGMSVRKALEDSRSKAPKIKPVTQPQPEVAKKTLAEIRTSLTGRS